MRNFILSLFEGLAWLFFVLIICGYTFAGYRLAVRGRIDLEPIAAAGIGLVVGVVVAIVVTGLIFTLLDMRSSLDRLVQIAEEDRPRRG